MKEYAHSETKAFFVRIEPGIPYSCPPISHRHKKQNVPPILYGFGETFHFVRPWGVEPQSKEPESFILSIELRAQNLSAFFKCATKVQLFAFIS